jgi:hypothetical protein
MKTLVLDTIHGGTVLARHLREKGEEVDMVDIYRGECGISPAEALSRRYDRVIAPVHLDPDLPLMHLPDTPVITHHDAVRLILGNAVPHPMIEITGARGKTTTAYALASLLSGRGVLHTSSGTWSFPDRALLWKRSIAPASAIDAAVRARADGGWCIAEMSLGVSGAGDVGVLTSGDDYPIAAGRKSARDVKLRSLIRCRTVVTAPGIDLAGRTVICADDAVDCRGDRFRYAWGGIEGEFVNPLGRLEGYKTPLMLAATVACVLSVDPAPLAGFSALPGRMKTRTEDGIVIVDNANSGTNVATTVEAARHARRCAGTDTLTLVIGWEAQNVCEGFPDEKIREAIRAVGPDHVVHVGTDLAGGVPFPAHRAGDLRAALQIAKEITKTGSIVLAVKTWR